MRREYDIFERFPDGSSLWRTCVCGRYKAERTMHELAEHAENDFFAIDVEAAAPLPVNFVRKASLHKNSMKQTA
jgi:hypothetical protein